MGRDYTFYMGRQQRHLTTSFSCQMWLFTEHMDICLSTVVLW